MENIREQMIANLREAIEKQKESLSLMEKELAFLEGDKSVFNDQEFDITLDELDIPVALVTDEPAEPVAEVTEDIPEDPEDVTEVSIEEMQPEVSLVGPEETVQEELQEESQGDGYEEFKAGGRESGGDLFGLFADEYDREKVVEKEISAEPENINELEAAHRKPTLMDVMEEKLAWRVDIPGAPVHNILSAVSLNDRVMFINSLFGGDPIKFQETVAFFNSLESFSEAEAYVREHYREWDLGSDIVYRFMMAVRRRLS